ncbi:MAG: hypothetical protein J6Y03_00845 [Alphaproteobacteria bacterium]|nr:hypothetical protein [Alphaproteobacteria bacterium]
MKKLSINQDVLKIAALLLMTVDHVGMFFSSSLCAQTCRLIGRASYPLFAYLLMMNLAKYQIFDKYLKRLGFFGIITFFLCIPIQFIFKVPVTFNILLGFWLVVAALCFYHKIEKLKCNKFLQLLLFSPLFILCAVAAIPFAYNFLGFLFCFCLYFYFLKKTPDWLILSLLLSYLINFDFCGPIISLLVTAFLLLGIQIKSKPRLLHHWWFFYVYYPAHIVVLALIAYFL